MLKIPNNTAQAILTYLVQRPYAEVFQLVAALRTLQPIEESLVAEEAEPE